MSRARPIDEMRIDQAVRKDILLNCSDPDLLLEVFNQADGLAFGRGTPEGFLAYCQTLPCIFWAPSDEGKRHVYVRIARMTDRQLRHVCRVIWRICLNVVTAQGPGLSADEEVLHLCGNNGAESTAFGTCLNPAHMIRGNAETRVNLKVARHLMKKALGTSQPGGMRIWLS